MKQQIHHLGYACEDIHAATLNIKELYDVKSISAIVFDELQNAHVCFIEINNSPSIELVSGESVKSFISNDMNLYHICYEVDDLEKSITQYKILGGVPLSKPKPAKLFNNRRVVFLNTDLGLIELLEKRAQHLYIKNMTDQLKNSALFISSTFSLSTYKQAITNLLTSVKSDFLPISAPENQLFQQLLDVKSQLRTNQRGYNIVLLRIEDLVKGKIKKDASYFKKIETHTVELIQIIKNAQKQLPCSYLFIICPSSDRFSSNEDLKKITDIEEVLYQSLHDIDKIKVLREHEITSLYTVKNIFDKYTNRIANIPYTPEFESALALITIREIYNYSTRPYKVLIVDCDQTLWDGVCAEVGPSGILITKHRQELQRFLLEQMNSGLLLCIISKNKKSDLLLAFNKANNMLLKKEHISFWLANWKNKSENIKTLSKKLNLSLSSFIFIDDNPFERAEVKLNCPTVFVPEIPDNPAKITNYLRKSLNIHSSSSLSKNRTVLYQESFKRDKELRKYNSLKEFILSLNLKLKINHITLSQVDRVIELMNRTTQFNTTSVKLSEKNLRDMALLKHGCLSVTATDRFGDYGLIGVAIYTINQNSLIVTNLLISCRALGKGIEHELIAQLGKISSEKNIANLIIQCTPTARNIPAMSFLDSLESISKKKTDVGYSYYLETKIARTCKYNPDKNESSSKRDKITSLTNKEGSIILSEKNNLNLILNKFPSPLSLLSSLKNKNVVVDKEMFQKKSIELSIGEIWRDVLGIKNIKVDDNFYDFGGDSLLAVRILSRIYKELAIELTLDEFFKNQTIEKLSSFIKRNFEKNLNHEFKLASVSHNQKSLWAIDKFYNGSWFYNMSLAITLNGKLDIQALKKAFITIVQRHEAFRTNFIEENGVLYQKIKSSISLPFELITIPGKSEENLITIAQKEERHNFNLDKNALIKIKLLKINSKRHILIITKHHIISDGWSDHVLFKEMSILYSAYKSGNNKPIIKNILHHYSDFITLQNLFLQSKNFDTQLNYWIKKLASIRKLNLTHGLVDTEEAKNTGQYCHFKISQSKTRALEAIARRCNTSLSTVLMAIFNVLLMKLSNQNDIAIGYPTFGRKDPNFEDTMGFFVNLLIIRNNVLPHMNFLTLIKQVALTLSDALKNQDIPFDLLVEKLNPSRVSNKNPLSDISFIWQNTVLDSLKLPGIKSNYLYYGSDGARSDLTLELQKLDGHISAGFYYRTPLFSEKKVKSFIADYQALITDLTHNPNHILSEVSLESTKKLHTLVARCNKTKYVFPKNKTLMNLFSDQLKRNSNKASIVFEDKLVTYRELNELMLKALSTLKNKGVTKGKFVGIFMKRSPLLVANIFAVLQCGAIFILLDGSLSTEILNKIIKENKLDFLIVEENSSYVASLKFNKKTSIIISKENDKTENYRIDPYDFEPSMPAYAIYTSGTTNLAKCVLISQKSILNFVYFQRDFLKISNTDHYLQFSSILFDSFIWEIFGALLNGSTLYLLPESFRLDPNEIFNFIKKHHITIAALPSEIFTYFPKKSLPSLKSLIAYGDICDQRSIDFWSKKTSFFNGYGLTETTVCASLNKLSAGLSPRVIGKPMHNSKFFILDGNDTQASIGVIGELYIAGDNIALGYLDDNNKTKQFFIKNRKLNSILDLENEVIYKTGDFAKRLENGDIEIVGRNDNQEKLHGIRINLSEIEEVINHCSLVENSHLKILSNDNQKKLIAYIIPRIKSKEIFDLSERPKILENLDITMKIRSFINSSIQYSNLKPEQIILLSHFPLKQSGKINECLLPINGYNLKQEDINKTQDIIIQSWKYVLNIDYIKIHDNFFDLGGNSFLLIKLFNELKLKISENFKIIDLFTYPSIYSFANFLKKSSYSIDLNTDKAPLQKNSNKNNDIAIIGMACKFPGAENLSAFWENLKNGVESIVFMEDNELLDLGINPQLLTDKNYIKACGYITNIDKFDAEFFGFSPEEARQLDPQQRVFLELAWEALENANCSPQSYDGTIAVFAGLSDCGYSKYFSKNAQEIVKPSIQRRVELANDRDFFATRLAYKLGLTGPAININTACSTSLVAVINACQTLILDEADVALAGGISLILPNNFGYLYEKGSIYSPNGHCHPFDSKAEGTIPSSGAGIVVLKKLKAAIHDGDHIYAVIKGGVINNDGNQKLGYVAPSVNGQAACIEKAQKKAGVLPEDISYIEAHGTGTSLGDPIEFEALSTVFTNSSCKHQTCAIGSVKSNIGHTNTASGIAGLIKTTLMLKMRKLVPSINYNNANSKLDFSNSPFYINTELSEWRTDKPKLYAAVSSFGIGGTNSHIILESYKEDHKLTSALKTSRALIISAKTDLSLHAYQKALACHLEKIVKENSFNETYFEEVIHTFQTGRTHFEKRKAFICSDIYDAIEKLVNNEYVSDISILNSACFLDLSWKKPLIKWMSGENVDWKNINILEQFRKVILPGYLFDRKSFWYTEKPSRISKNIKENHEENEVQTFVLDIFKKSLGYEDLKLEDDIFRIGCDSIILLQIIAEIEKDYKIQIKTTDFDESNTIKRISELILRKLEFDTPLKVEKNSFIVPLKSKGDKTPIFLIHPGSGEIFHYKALVAHMSDDQPIYAIQNPLINDIQYSFLTMEEMASAYISIIKKIQPTGPYILGGWSFGGSVAYEMAYQLRDKNEGVSFVALFDGWASFPSCLANWVYFVKTYSTQFNKQSGIADFNTWLHLLWNRVQLMMNYQPKQGDFNITLFKAKTIAQEYKDYDSPNNLWGQYAKGNLQVVSVSGNHFTLLQHQSIKKFSQAFESILKKQHPEGSNE